MKDFITEFEKNIPEISSEIGSSIGGGSDSWSVKEVEEVAKSVLEDFLKLYKKKNELV